MTALETALKYQPLISMAVGALSALVIGPRIAERYARSREYWHRRIDFSKEIAAFALILQPLPEAPDDLLTRNHPQFQVALEKVVVLCGTGRLLYEDRL
ncbi:MAG TPA: hypothetical protein VG817_09565, partial [Gemmatimonadales bacterium]|nr:hypothetical protein [Gemmatimonadales bacterium]